MCWNCIISVCNSHVQDSQLHTCNTRTHNYIAHSCTRVLLIAARTLLTAAHVYWLIAADVHCSQLQYSQLHTCNTHSCTRAILTATLLTAAQVQCLQLQTCIAHSCPYIAHILLIRAILTAAHDTRAILTAAHVQYSQLHTCNAHSCTRAMLTAAQSCALLLHPTVRCTTASMHPTIRRTSATVSSSTSAAVSNSTAQPIERYPRMPSRGVVEHGDRSESELRDECEPRIDGSVASSLSQSVCRNWSTAITLRLTLTSCDPASSHHGVPIAKRWYREGSNLKPCHAQRTLRSQRTQYLALAQSLALAALLKGMREGEQPTTRSWTCDAWR